MKLIDIEEKILSIGATIANTPTDSSKAASPAAVIVPAAARLASVRS